MTMRSTMTTAIVLAAALSVAAARGEEPAPAAAGIETAKAVEPAADPPYDPTGRRDPFLPPRVGPSIVSGTASPLQRYDVGQLRLVAVIYDTREPRAVVEDDQGLGYIVRLGTPIGTNGGAVSAIQRGKMIIQEDTVDFYGEHRPVEVTMELRTAEQSN
jgi:type IV pilus assembly protein PilP